MKESAEYYEFRAGQLAPIVIVSSVRRDETGHQFADLSCGHIIEYSPHCSVSIGSRVRCRKCGREIVKAGANND